jgi:hypothetical protein
MRAWKKWRGVGRVTEDDSWRKGGRREIMNLPFGERLTWKGAGHVANDEWMMRREVDHADQGAEADG